MQIFRAPGRVKAMTFDLDDTLYDNHPYIVEAEKRLLAHMKRNYPNAASKPSRFWQQHKRIQLTKQPALMSDMGMLRKLTLSSGFKECGYRGDKLHDAVKDCFEYFYHERSNFQVNDDIQSVLSALSAKIPLVAITNGNVNLDQIGIAPYFKASFHASMDKPMKPDPCMFNLAVETLGIPAENILHVGDNLEKDVMGANNAGLHSAWFACNRPMHLPSEPVSSLPSVVLESLSELTDFVA